MILTLIFYFFIAVIGCQILNDLLSPKKKNKKEGFSHELESGPFDEQQQYKIPQPSEPVNAPVTNQVSQTPTAELNNLYSESGIDLSAEIVDPDVEAEDRQEEKNRNYSPIASNEAEVTTIAPFDQ